MRIKQITLSIFVLTGLVVAVLTIPVSAQEAGPRVLQLASTGQGRAHAVVYSPDGETLAIGASLGIYLYNSSDLQLIRFIPIET